MAVYRTHKTKDFTTMANFHLRDKTLSLKAKGLLSMMLSLPEDWVYSIEGLVSISKEGERAVKSALAELQDVGYVVVTKKYPNKTSNKITYEYDVYEIPKLEQELREAQHSVGVQNQDIQNVALQNVGLLNTNNKILNTKEKELDTNVSNSKKKSFTPPSMEEVKAYVTEQGYHFDANQFYQYYAVDNWHKADGTPVKNWKRCCITWESKADKTSSVPQSKSIYETL